MRRKQRLRGNSTKKNKPTRSKWLENSSLSKSATQPNPIPLENKSFRKFSHYGYSFFAILIFLGGVYSGAKYIPSKNLPESSFSVNTHSAVRISNKISEPEDFFPVAEFRKQSAILIGCQNQIHLMPKLYGDIAKAIGNRVPLFGVVGSETQALRGAELIRSIGLPPHAMRFLVIPSNSIWIRDYAPFILRYDDDRALMVDAKYHTRMMREGRKQDDFMGFELARSLGLPVRSIPLVLEGGNFISNSDGLLLTSSKTISVNKEGHFTHKQLIAMFNDYLGVNGVIALHPLIGEPNGHLDMFMTMLGKNLAVIAEIHPSIDSENSARLDETAKLVSSLSTSVGPIKVKRIPMPPKWGNDWRSYTNVIMANGVLLMPSFSDVDPVLEDQAEEVYRSLLPPDWEVKRIDCSSLVALRGQLHCISYNIPQFISIDGLQEKAFPRSQENKN